MDVMCNSHKPKYFYSLEALLEHCVAPPKGPHDHVHNKWTLFWTKKWNTWRKKNPGLPLVLRCSTCSGEGRDNEERVKFFRSQRMKEQDKEWKEWKEDV